MAGMLWTVTVLVITVTVVTSQDCVDHVFVGLTCADLPNPCNDTVGLLTCPKFCGTCKPNPCVASACLNGGTCSPVGDTYTCQCPATHTGLACHIPVSGGSGSCPNQISTMSDLGCRDVEVVFLIEYARSDTTDDIDHEGDFIKEVISHWPIGASNIRVGVVAYHDTVREAFHIGDHNSRQELSDRISRLTRVLRGSDEAYLAKALDYVRTTSFTGARPGVEKIVIPIIHQMDHNLKDQIVPAATRLKNDCVTLFGITVSGPSLDRGIVERAVTQPYSDHMANYATYDELENAGRVLFRPTNSASCTSSACLNGGTCVPAGDSYTCQCPSTHTGLVCHIPAPTNCPNQLSTIRDLGCRDAEVVFMIEYARSDSTSSIDHEGDFIKEVIDQWPIGPSNIRVGVVSYHDTVSESFHIGDHNTDTELKNSIYRLTRGLRGSGTSDLAKALDYVRTTSFTGARPGVEKIVIPIIHQMDNNLKDQIVPAATRLKNDCVTLFGVTVSGFTLDRSIIEQAVTQPYSNHMANYNSFIELENAARFFYSPNCN